MPSTKKKMLKTTGLSNWFVLLRPKTQFQLNY